MFDQMNFQYQDQFESSLTFFLCEMNFDVFYPTLFTNLGLSKKNSKKRRKLFLMVVLYTVI